MGEWSRIGGCLIVWREGREKSWRFCKWACGGMGGAGKRRGRLSCGRLSGGGWSAEGGGWLVKFGNVKAACI